MRSAVPLKNRFLFILLMLCAASSYAAEPKETKDAVWVNQVFQKGKAYYESGNYTAASREWNKLDPYLDQYPSFKKVIGYLKNQVQTVKPDDSVRVTMQKGRVAYENGDWKLALREWKKVEPYLDPSSTEYGQLQKLKRDYETAQLIDRQDAQAPGTSSARAQVPAEFNGYLQDASIKLQKQILEIQSRRESLEKDVVFEQAWVDTTFEKGKTAFEAGNYDLAAEEWDRLTLKLKDDPQVAAAIDGFKRSRRDFREAELSYSDSAGRAGENRQPANERIQSFLKQAASDLQEKAGKVSRQGLEKQQSLADMQKKVDEAFQRGQQFYQQGKFKEAMDEWLMLQPYFEGDLVTKAAFLSAQGSLRSYEMASSTYQGAVDSGSYKLRLPEGFFRYVENASHELAAKTSQAESDRQTTESAVAAKRTELIQAFERGKSAYALGRFQEAVNEWRKLSPWVENAADFNAELKKLEANHSEASRQIAALKQAQARSAEAYSPPAALMQTLVSANEDLKNQARTAVNERLVVDQGLNDRQARVTTLLYKANLAAKSGKTDEAIGEWEKMLPYLSPAAEERALVESMKQNYADYAKASEALRLSSALKEQRLELPPELKRSLSGTNDSLLEKAAQARTQLKLTETGLQQTRTVTVSALEKARLFHETGRYDEVINELEKVFPYMDPASSDRLLIENLKQNWLDSKEASKQLASAAARSGERVSLPADLKQALAQVSQQFIQKTDQARNERSALDTQTSDRRAVVNSAIEKSRVFQKTGRLDQALSEWTKLSPYLDEASEEYAAIESVKQGFAEYTKAAALHSESFAKKEVSAQMPEDLKRSLSQANQDLITQTNQLRTKRDNREQTQRERHVVVQSAIEKGKLYFQTSRLDSAITEWEKLITYLDPASEDRLLIESLKQTQSEFKKVSAEFRDTVSRGDAKTEVPADLRKILADTSKAMLDKTNELRIQRQGLETQFSDRQTALLATLERARVYTQAGRIEEALSEWKKAVDFLDEKSGAKALVQELDRNYAQFVTAKQALDEALPKRDAKFPPPGDLKTLLEDVRNKLATDSQGLQVRRQVLEKDLQDRQSFVDRTFLGGKTLAMEGKWLEALNEWDKLLPHLEESSGIAALLQNVKKDWQSLQETKRANELFVATRYRDLKMPFTAEMEKMMIELDGKVQNDTAAAQTQRADMEKTLAERQTWVSSTFEKGKAYYEVGKFKEAIEFWSSLAPHLKDEQKVQSLILALPQRHEALVQAQKAAQAAETRRDTPIAPPADMSKILEEASARIGSLSMEGMSRSEKAAQADALRRLTVNQLFQEGQTFADQGQWEAAVRAWSGILPHVQGPEKMKAALDNLQASHANYVNALTSAAQAEADLNTPLPSPAELSQVLSDASFKLDKERQATELIRERTDKILAEKQTAVQKLYADGKAFYDQGKLADAFAAWRSMLPSVQGEGELRLLLEKADQSYQSYVTAKEQNQQSMAKKEMKLEAPSELPMMLETVNTQLRDQVFDMKTKSTQTEKMLADRKDWMDVTFQKGKLAYAQGRYKEAVAEWKTMLPFVEDGIRLENGIGDFERNLNVSLEASKTNAEADAKKNMKFPAPDELGVLLVELNEKVKNEALEAGAEKIRAEQQVSERQTWLKQTFDLGKSFYLEGKLDQAIAEWEKLAPYLEAQTGMQSLMEAVKQSHQASLEAKKGAVQAIASDYQGLQLPYAEQMEKLLTEVDAKLKEEAVTSRTKQGELEKTLAERQEWSVTTFNKGKVFYDQGRYEEAMGQWERLLPYLAEGSETKQRIVSLRASLNTINSVKEVSTATGSGEPPVQIQNEQEILGVLEDANEHFKSEAETLRQKQLEANQSVEQRKQWIEFTFQKGKTYYDQGNYAKAIEEWGVLGPYLGEHPKVRDRIADAKQNYDEGRYAKQIIDSLDAKRAALMPLPAQATPQTPMEHAVPAVIAENIQAPAPAGGVEELVSGEIVSVDEPGRTITLKLYTESGSDETLTVNFDERTQVDGSASQTLSTMPSGSAIDVRYNPQTSRAQYIYVY